MIVALDLQQQNFAEIAGKGQLTAVDDAERIERLLGGYRYPMEQDAEHVE